MFHISLIFVGLTLPIVAGIMAILIIGWLVYILIKSVITYIFESIFLYNVSKKEQYKHTFISYIPIANRYYLGKVANKNVIGIINIIVQILILSWWVLFFITDFYMYVLNPITDGSDTYNTVINPIWILIILMLINFILSTYLSHKIMKNIIGKKAVLFTILNIVTLGISRPIVLFVIRKNKKEKIINL